MYCILWVDAWLDLSVFTQANKGKFQNKTHTDLTEGEFTVDIDLNCSKVKI